ncbi:MAG TPA: hypothetical protein VFB96_18130 [Pirellulaceae bacterium]|nr:hypothetical protein [Pirellulaceae bacterium]
MRKFLLIGCLGAIVIGWCISPALGIAPFNLQWRRKYLDGNKNEEFIKAAKAANCHVCHNPSDKAKKETNDYGKAVGKFLTKADFEKFTGKLEASKKYIFEGLEKAEAEKAADGTTYGEKIKAGKLPAE